MRRKKLLYGIAVVLLAVNVMIFIWYFFHGRFAGLVSFYQENEAAFETSAQQLQALMEEIKSKEVNHRDHDVYIEVHFRQKEGSVTLYQCGWKEEGCYGVVNTEYPLSDFPELQETLKTLYSAGIWSVYVYDFSHITAQNGGSPCEIWYGTHGGSLVYSANGSLTHSYDVTMIDGPGYRIYQKKWNDNWFAAVSRYDKNSYYWRT